MQLKSLSLSLLSLSLSLLTKPEQTYHCIPASHSTHWACSPTKLRSCETGGTQAEPSCSPAGLNRGGVRTSELGLRDFPLLSQTHYATSQNKNPSLTVIYSSGHLVSGMFITAFSSFCVLSSGLRCWFSTKESQDNMWGTAGRLTRYFFWLLTNFYYISLKFQIVWLLLKL